VVDRVFVSQNLINNRFLSNEALSSVPTCQQVSDVGVTELAACNSS